MGDDRRPPRTIGQCVSILKSRNVRPFIALVCLFFILSLWRHVDVDVRRRESWLCKIDPNRMNNLVWSHRGHLDGFIEGSSGAMAALRHMGVLRFDVDIVYHRDKLSGDIYFYVSHPSEFDQMHPEKHQHLGTFLHSLVAHRQYFIEGSDGDDKGIMASLEPKFFQETKVFQQFLEYVNKHEAAPLCGIVVRFKQDIEIIENLTPRPMVSLGRCLQFF